MSNLPRSTSRSSLNAATTNNQQLNLNASKAARTVFAGEQEAGAGLVQVVARNRRQRVLHERSTMLRLLRSVGMKEYEGNTSAQSLFRARLSSGRGLRSQRLGSKRSLNKHSRNNDSGQNCLPLKMSRSTPMPETSVARNLLITPTGCKHTAQCNH